ncbi:hypothetical protein PHLCEN_2v4503 [Hermanssonia centrifuga]|uniref:Peptidase M24 domain-containing protein n=1 Tax=Hermanssonia centrifuga TaxID=98765 RepID=A0A2R6PN92_9APHY|nr:hypothetical protein PHLCEN_2v4503 [Hermanssonia centrifuga]
MSEKRNGARHGLYQSGTTAAFISERTMFRICITFSIAMMLSLLAFRLRNPLAPSPVADFSGLKEHCAHVSPIPTKSFIKRQDLLAKTLHSLGASAYIAEPGANAGFYANLSGSHWHLSERPLLLIVTPTVDEKGAIRGNISILTPMFEATRARLLPIPSDSEITFPEWPEDMDPYQVALSAISDLDDGTIFVDGSTRQFVVDGLQKAAGGGSKVVSAPVEIRRLRERKSKEELNILKCANEVTILAIREARRRMHIGMKESEARSLVRTALSAAGLENLDSITLFGPDAALPHGTGTNRELQKTDFVLIDCGGSLHGYYSDVTRTFALPGSEIPADHLAIWYLVFAAQSAAIETAKNGTITAEVDRAARRTIHAQGYGKYFTHRLGHGIGLEVHESPYLRGGSEDVILTGHTFSDEPGVYIEGQVCRQ